MALAAVSRPARGAWIEIGMIAMLRLTAPSRAPRGARGLKFKALPKAQRHILSRPARGAWIEIQYSYWAYMWNRSRPARGAWIEILSKSSICTLLSVAPREGRVD